MFRQLEARKQEEPGLEVEVDPSPIRGASRGLDLLLVDPLLPAGVPHACSSGGLECRGLLRRQGRKAGSGVGWMGCATP